MCGGRPSLFAFRKLGGERCSNVVRARLKEYTVVVKGLDTSAAGAKSGSFFVFRWRKIWRKLEESRQSKKDKGEKVLPFSREFLKGKSFELRVLFLLLLFPFMPNSPKSVKEVKGRAGGGF